MSTTDLIILAFVVVHLIGILLLFVNGVYLICTRGYGSTRISEDMFRERRGNLNRSSSERCCKIRAGVACNILVLYHTTLIMIEIVLGIICEVQDSWKHQLKTYQNLTYAFWVSAVSNYGFLLFMLPYFSAAGSCKRDAYIGQLYVCNIFEFLNLVIFWATLLLSFVCAGLDCNQLPSPVGELASGLGALLLVPSYIILLIGAIIYYKRDKPFEKTISIYQAVNFMNEKIEEAPSIEWTISCGHDEGSGEDSHYVELHRETISHTFSGTNYCKTTSNIDNISENLFRRKLTELVLQTHVKPVDAEIQRDISRHRELFRHRHSGHDETLSLTTKNDFRTRYFVGSRNNNSTVQVMYWIFSFLALSLPYRWFMYFGMGHVNLKVKKEVSRCHRDEARRISRNVFSVDRELPALSFASAPAIHQNNRMFTFH